MGKRNEKYVTLILTSKIVDLQSIMIMKVAEPAKVYPKTARRDKFMFVR